MLDHPSEPINISLVLNARSPRPHSINYWLSERRSDGTGNVIHTVRCWHV